jgi:aminoglycoside phosphotransferase (APT) family kinase protein
VDEVEIRLEAGNTSSVWRRGNTIRRSTGPWTPAVHALLRHLAAAGFDGAPRVLGIDERGREVLTYVEGEVPVYPAAPELWSEQVLAAVARLLRRLHDATVGFDLPAAGWREGAGAPGGGEVVCHNDIAHYNTVFVAGWPVAFIDWDFAAPGPRAWDVAYAAYRFVPLGRDEHAAGLGAVMPVDRPGRLRRFCDAYGLAEANRAGLVEVILDRVQAVFDLIVAQAAKGDPAFQRHLAEGHLDGYQRDLAYIESLREPLEEALAPPSTGGPDAP